jgi:hypothetical protein
MEIFVHNICDLSDNQRSAAEQLIGHALRDHQQLIIQVVGGNGSTDQPAALGDRLPEWCNIYEGLTDAEISDLEQSIVRSDSTRFGN